VKHAGLEPNSEELLTAYNVRIIKGVLEIVVMQADFIVDWLTLFNFLSNLYYLLSANHPLQKKVMIENKSFLTPELSILTV